MDDLVSALGVPWLTATLLLSVRLAALFTMSPLLHLIPVPPTVRVLLLLGLAAALSLPLSQGTSLPPMSPGGLVAAMLQEFAVGATLGLGVLMAFSGFALAGRLLDIQVGFGLGQVFDPVLRTQVPVLTSFFGVLGVLLFFLANGHHALMRGIAYSLERFPLGRPWSLPATAAAVLQQAAGLFTLGFALAAPVVLLLLLTEFALGVLARNLPQMNMFVLAIPVKIVAGLLLLSLWAGGMGEGMQRMYAGIHRGWTAVFDAQDTGRR